MKISVVIMLLCAAVSAQIPFDPEPTFRLAFEDGGTRDTKNLYTVGLSNSATTAGGLIGNALTLATTGRFAQINNSTNFAHTNKFTISVLAFSYPNDGSSTLFSKHYNASTYGIQLSVSYFGLYAGGANPQLNFAQIPSGTRTHVVASYDGATMRVYLNGNLTTSLASVVSIPNNSNPIRIGKQSDGGSSSFQFVGQIDEVCWWSVVLSDAQVGALFQSYRRRSWFD